MSGFTSNLSRSKSFRYSMAKGLGGKEVSGRDGDDMAEDCAESERWVYFVPGKR